MPSRLGAAIFLILALASLDRARAQEDKDEKPTPDRLFEIAKGLLDDRAQGNKGAEHKKRLKALDAILEETTFGKGDTSKAKLTGDPFKLALERSGLTIVKDEDVHETSIDSSFVVAESVRVTSITKSIVIARDAFTANGCTSCLVVCLGDFVCTSSEDSAIFVLGRAEATEFTRSAVWAKDANLVPELDADVKEMSEKLDDRARVRLGDAKALLRQTGGRNKALRLIRKLRLEASIPLMLQYVHDSDDRESWSVCARTITLLTGEILSPPEDIWSTPGRRSGVRRWVRERWPRLKATLSTDLEKLDASHRERVARELVAIVLEGAGLKPDDLDLNFSAENAHRVLTGLLDREAFKSEAILPEDVSPCLVPVLLDRATEPAGAFAAARVLGAFYSKGELAGIDKIGADESKPPFVRLAALLAAWVAGEDYPTAPILGMLAGAKKLEDRAALVLALGKGKDKDAVLPKLVDQLADKNEEIRDAALYAIGDLRPKTLPDAVKELPSKRDDWADDAAILHAITSVKGDKESMTIVAKALAEAVKDGGDRGSKAVHDRLVALERVSDQKWRSDHDPPTPRDPRHPERAYSRDVRPARAALQWWETEKDK